MVRIYPNRFAFAVDHLIAERENKRKIVEELQKRTDPCHGLDPDLVQCISTGDVISYSELLRNRKK